MDKITIKLTKNSNATLTGYFHKKSKDMPHMNNRPAILIFPGGGYNKVSDRENEPIASKFFAEGYQVFVLEYSVGDKARNLQPLTEAALAIIKIRDNASEWRIDANKIAVCGFSAGGHLAGSLGVLCYEDELLKRVNVDKEYLKPNALILCYPVITSGKFAHRGSFFQLTGFNYDEDNSMKYSVERYVTQNTPPTFIWHAVDDKVVPVENTLLMVNALQKHKVTYECHLFNKGGHGISACTYEVNSKNDHCGHWFQLCIEWLSDQFDFIL